MVAHRKARPMRAHWLLLATLLVTVAFLLTVQALTIGELGADSSAPTGRTDQVPASVLAGGAVIDTRQGHTVTHRLPDHTLALTFDDGPDPTWTPQILALLARYHVPATFFVTGTHAARYPGLIKQILGQGNEIGSHTFTHVNLGDAGSWRTSVELRSTDLALAHAGDVATALVRMPYSATPDSLDNTSWRAIQRLNADGRLVVMTDLDSQDWQRPGIGAIVANATPRDQRGAIVMMHDSGGDRAQTVAALNRLIPSLLAKGWRFSTVGQGIGAADVNTPASATAQFGGWLVAITIWAANALAAALGWLLIISTVLAALRTVVVLTCAALHVRRVRRPRQPEFGQPASVIIPAYNEELGIEATVRSALASRHPVEVIVVDDGSTDRTADVVESLGLRGVRLIRQRNAGKPAALNAGLAAARYDVVVMVDGDTVLEPGTVGILAQHFRDGRIGAVSGNAKVANRSSVLGGWQHIEYVIGFNLDRRAYDVLQCMPTVPGAVGAFRRSAVMAVGGLPKDTLAEDTDLTMALETAGWRVTYEERALAWTEAPSTLGQLWKQRYRWCYGTLQAIWKHRGAVLRRGTAGRLGRRGLPYLMLFQVVLPVLAPVVDVAGVFGLVTGNPITTGLTWLSFLLLQAVPGVIAFRLDRERLWPLLLLPLQQFVYRQLMYLVVLQSVATAIAGVRLPWHKLERRGVVAPASSHVKSATGDT
ncbi:MAG TPA: bifunctional polysaccharide deacetylase/glycosyltransferase family 2 protein [Pseudonocardiaceae bacterium]|nr:bifunctional polysaccharide deacetylase/glycosyltransferase family 2 protein [Pseudonocardiaceae bacterium]